MTALLISARGQRPRAAESTVCSRLLAAQVGSLEAGRSLFGFERPAPRAGLREALFVSVAARQLLATSQLCHSWLGIGGAWELAVRYGVEVRYVAQVPEAQR